LPIIRSLSSPAAALGDAIELWFTPGSTFYQINLDNVRLEAVATIGDQQPSAAPEPATILLMGSGFAGLAAVRRRKKQHPAL